MKTLEHVLKIFVRIIELLVREKVKIGNIQFGFMGRKRTTDAIFLIGQLKEKYIVKKKGFGWHLLFLRKHLNEYLARWSGGRRCPRCR